MFYLLENQRRLTLNNSLLKNNMDSKKNLELFCKQYIKNNEGGKYFNNLGWYLGTKNLNLIEVSNKDVKNECIDVILHTKDYFFKLSPSDTFSFKICKIDAKAIYGRLLNYDIVLTYSMLKANKDLTFSQEKNAYVDSKGEFVYKLEDTIIAKVLSITNITPYSEHTPKVIRVTNKILEPILNV